MVCQRPLQALLGAHSSSGSDHTLLHLNEGLGVVPAVSGPGGHSQSAALRDMFQSGEVVAQLALHTQLWPAPHIQPQKGPSALVFGVHRGFPDAVRVLPHGAIKMGLDWAEHQQGGVRVKYVMI